MPSRSDYFSCLISSLRSQGTLPKENLAEALRILYKQPSCLLEYAENFPLMSEDRMEWKLRNGFPISRLIEEGFEPFEQYDLMTIFINPTHLLTLLARLKTERRHSSWDEKS